jgi:hypothetical protein
MRGFPAVAPMAERLPIASVPEAFPIAFVWLYMVSIRCRLDHAQLEAIDAQWIVPQECLAGANPLWICIETTGHDGRWRSLRLGALLFQTIFAALLVNIAVRQTSGCNLFTARSRTDFEPSHNPTNDF